jgi:hypothetical protein
MNPLVRSRWRHPNELSLHLWERRLCHVSQEEEPLVGRRGERTGFIRTGAAARAGWPIKRAVIQVVRQRRLEMGQQRWKFGFRESGQRSSTPGTLDDLFIPWHRPLPPR